VVPIIVRQFIMSSVSMKIIKLISKGQDYQR